MAKSKRPQTDKEISLVVNETEKIAQDLEPLQGRILALDMERDKNYEKLLSQGRVVREVERQIKDKQKWALSGLDEARRRVKSLFVPMIKVCGETLQIIDKKQIEYDLILTRRQEEEQRQRDEEAEAERKRLKKNLLARARRADEEDGVAMRHAADHIEVESVTVEKEAPPKVDGVSVAKIWDFSVMDGDLIPRQYKTDDDVLVLWTKQFDRRNLMKFREGLMGDQDNELLRSTIEEQYGIRFFQKDSTRYGRL